MRFLIICQVFYRLTLQNYSKHVPYRGTGQRKNTFFSEFIPFFAINSPFSCIFAQKAVPLLQKSEQGMQANIFQRYIWLVNTISSAGKISKKELDSRWSRSSVNDAHESEYPRTTLFRHREDIAEIFGIDISVDRRDNTYYIEHAENMRTDDLRRWLMNNFAVNNALTESKSLRSRILAEQIPEGHHFLPTIINAMRDSHVLLVEHGRFGQQTKCFMLEPYCLKVFKQRWYVYGRPSNHPDERRIYALDRIGRLEETEATFCLPEDFDAEQEFSIYYGVFTDKPAEVVRVRVYKQGVPFLRSLPIHHSQQEVLTEEEYSEFEYYVAPTFDFVQQLRTYGAQMTVVSPTWLRDNMRHEAEVLVAQYTDLSSI